MAAYRDTGKSRASRIPMDYFKRGDRMSRTKLWLSWLTLIAVGVWIGLGFNWLGLAAAATGKATLQDVLFGDGWQSEAGRLRGNHGPVTAVHAAWEGDCQACHIPYKRITDDGTPGRWFSATKAEIAERCQTCHQGPDHHPNQKPEKVTSCNYCHRDHKGRDASLVSLPDQACTICHANLTAHLAGATTLADASKRIGSFSATQHPQFSYVEGKSTDPGKLKFNHKLHLSPGVRYLPDAAAFRFRHLAKDDQERYKDDLEAKSDDDEVTLRCESCHVLDSSVSASAKGMPPRASGALFLPVNYDRHCKACHTLDISAEPTLSSRELQLQTRADQPRAKPIGRAMPVPHGRQPAELQELLLRAFTASYLREQTKVLDEPVKALTIPGRPTPVGYLATVRQAIADRVKLAEKQLYTGKQNCNECHYFANAESAKESLAESDLSRTVADGKLIVQAPGVPLVWWKNARFGHTAHRAINCRECHASAYADAKGASEKASDVLLPGIENCVQCHAPATTSGGQRLGGVRFGCTECHNYHHVDMPLQGRGAPAFAPLRKLDAKGMMNGSRAAKSAEGKP